MQSKSAEHAQKITLRAAAANDREDQVAKLIAGGCNPREADEDGNTFIHTAAKHNSSKVLNRFIDAYKELAELGNNVGNTPLHLAADNGCLECIEILLSNWNLMGLRNKKKETALHKAAAGRNAGVLSLLLLVAPENILDARDEIGRSALHYCATAGDGTYQFADAVSLEALSAALEVAWKRINRAAPSYLDAVDNSGKTALMYSTVSGDLEAVKVLLNHGADVTVDDTKLCRTALHFAARFNNYATLGEILQHAAKRGDTVLIHAINSFGETALLTCLAGYRPDINCVKQLLDSGSDLGVTDVRGKSALHHSVGGADSCGNAMITQMIVDAIRKTPSAMESFLACDTRNHETAFHVAARAENTDCIRQFGELEPGYGSAAMTVRNKDQWCPLHLAAQSPNPDVLKVFLKAFYNPGESKNDVDVAGGQETVTALMICAYNGDAAGVKLLLEHGADISRLDCADYNPVFAAVEGSIGQVDVDGHIQVLEIFKDKLGCRTMGELYSTKVPRKMLSPLALAATRGSAAILETMLEHAWLFPHGKKECCFIRHIVPSSLFMNAKDARMEKCYGSTCLELIAKHRKQDEVVKLFGAKPMMMCVSSLSTVRTGFFYSLFLLHLAFMCCFSVFVIPTCSFNATSPENHSAPAEDPELAALLVWPGLLLLYEALHFLIFLNDVRQLSHPFSALQGWLRKFFEFCCDRNDISSSTYIPYFSLMSHLATIGFCSLVLTWFVVYAELNGDSFQSYVSLVAVVLVYGWIQTMEFVKGWPTIHAFCFMVKLIVIKDILRIVFIYVFVLVGFALAFHVYLVSGVDTAESGDANVLNSLYQTFALMTGMGSWTSMSLTEDEQLRPGTYAGLTMMNLLFALCICASTIILMNILIAMMNKTYQDVTSLQETLWCIDVLQFIVWISQHDMLFWIRDIYRWLLVKFVYCTPRLTDDDVYHGSGEFAVSQRIREIQPSSLDEQSDHINSQKRLSQRVDSICRTVEMLSNTFDLFDRRTRAEASNKKAHVNTNAMAYP